jgi:2-amino-4-hydroxy-6-hydroxymethyldihydropteridine diphosphokinase
VKTVFSTRGLIPVCVLSSWKDKMFAITKNEIPIKDESIIATRMKYFISLGSNLGDRRKNLAQAVSLLQKNDIRILKASSVYEASPVGFTSQPWFLNQVIEIETNMQPESFLIMAKKIEKSMGRKRTIQKGPRCIDIDILLVENRVIQTKKVQIPHPELEKRKFVLTPLREISPETIHPVLEEKIEDLWRKCQDTSSVVFFKKSNE